MMHCIPKKAAHLRGNWNAPFSHCCLQFEAGFTSLAHTEEDITKTVEAAKRVFQRI